MQNLHNSFLLIFFISDLIRDERYVYYYLHIFHLLWDLIWYWHQTSTFPSLLAHLSICALPWMYKLHTLKASCLFLHFLIGEWDNQIFRIISLDLFWRWKTYNCQRCTFWSSSFLKQGNLWLCQYQLAKKKTKKEGCFFIINVVYVPNQFFPSFWMKLAGLKTTGRFICNIYEGF